MKFTEYLSEMRTYDEDRSIEITKEDAIKDIENKCGQILNTYRKNKKVGIWRGTQKNIGYYFTDPTKYNRMSRNTTNFYTVLLDNLPTWKEYPKRSQGIISTSDMEAAYNNAYAAFPYDNSKIGVCPGEDMWQSFVDRIGYLNDFNVRMQELFHINLDFKDKKELMIGLAKMQDMLKSPDTFNRFNDIVNNLYIKDTNLFDFFNKILNPENNGFKLYNTSNYVCPNEAHEVWFSSPAIMIFYRNGDVLQALGVK